MYEKIKADISNEYYLTNYPNDGQRFVAWYLRNIHNLDTYETKDCITDGAGDKQIDAIYIDNQSSTIYIIQGKFYGGDTVDAEPLREVLSSWVQIKDLEHLQDDVLRGDPGAKSALERDAHHERHGDVVRTSAHSDCHIETAGAEGEHADASARRRVGIGADQGLAGLAEAFKMHLMADAVAGARKAQAEFFCG